MPACHGEANAKKTPGTVRSTGPAKAKEGRVSAAAEIPKRPVRNQLIEILSLLINFGSFLSSFSFFFFFFYTYSGIYVYASSPSDSNTSSSISSFSL